MEKDKPAFEINECNYCTAEIINDGDYCDICSLNYLCESCIGDHECDFDDRDE